ncbi:hypothetical protein Tco_0847887 [Tanacetum coccineum]
MILHGGGVLYPDCSCYKAETSSTCFEYGVKGHYKSECPKLKNQNCGNQNGNGGARGRAFVIGGGEAFQDPNVVMEHIIVAGAENRPPMLEKSMYDSWASRIRLFIKGKKHGRMMLDSINNGPVVYLTIEENGQTRPKKYSKLTEAQQIQDDCDVQATNIILHGLPPDVYALVNHQEAAKDI